MALIDTLTAIGREFQVRKEVQIGAHSILLRSLTSSEYMDAVNFANEVSSYGTLSWFTAMKVASLSSSITQIDTTDFGDSDKVDTGERDRAGIAITMQKSVFVRKVLQQWPLDTIENLYAAYLITENDIIKYNESNIKYEGQPAAELIRTLDQQISDMTVVEQEEKRSEEIFTKEEERTMVQDALKEAIAAPVR